VGIGIFFYLFCSLDLDPMTFIYELDPYSIKLPTSRLSKFIVLQTDRQTDTTEITYHAALQVVKNDYIYKNGNR